jgi:hypothetical protein
MILAFKPKEKMELMVKMVRTEKTDLHLTSVETVTGGLEPQIQK